MNVKKLILYFLLGTLTHHGLSQDKTLVLIIDFEGEVLSNFYFDLYQQKINKPVTISITSKKDSILNYDALEGEDYFVRIRSLYGETFVRNIKLHDKDTTYLKIEIPNDGCVPVESIRNCPHGHRDKVIKIRYGHSKLLTIKERLGLIHNPGSIVYGCNVKYYCKKHRITF